jgi:EmrB/QacA subfamily drug resistance transporter
VGVNRREDPDSLLGSDDLGGIEFGALGTEAGSDLNWFKLLTARAQERASKSSAYQWWVLWSLLAGLFALNFTFTVFNVSLPTVKHEFHTSTQTLTWTMVGPLLAYGLAAPLFGKLGDIFGHRRLYIFGLVGAALSAILTATSGSIAMLLIARTLDGIQGAATGTASGALVNTVFKPDQRVKAMGWWSLVGAGGPVLGVSVGSPIIAAYGWRALFWVQLALLVIALGVVATILPRRLDHRENKTSVRDALSTMDWPGSLALSLSVAALMLGVSFGQPRGWTSPTVLGCFVVAAVAMAAFVVRIRVATHPLIPASYFRQRNFVLPMVVRATSNFAYFGGFFLFPLLMEYGYGYSLGRVGAIAVARPIVFAIASPIAGYVSVRIGEKISTIAGTSFIAGSMVLFGILQPSTGSWVVVIALSLAGMGMGVAMPASSAIMAYEVKPHEFGVMSAAQLLAMQVGEVAGIDVLVAIQQASVTRHHLEHAAMGDPRLLATFAQPFLVGAAVGVVAIVAAIACRRPPRRVSE